VSVTTPPRETESEHDRDLEQRVADLEALIEEARQRARRRRRRYGAAVLLVAAGVVASFIGFGGKGGGGTAVPGRAPDAQGPPAGEHARAAAAVTSCWKTLLNDAYDGYIDSGYSVGCYTSALHRLPYSGVTYVLRRDVH
jgi:hypothetical protein